MPNSIPLPSSRRPSLVAWLFAGVFGATLVTVLACTLIMDTFMREGTREDATRFLQTNADALRDALDRGMAQNFEQVRVIGQLNQVTDTVDPKQVQQVLDQVHASFPQFAWLGMAGVDGRIRAGTDGLLQGVDASARPWFAGARHASYVGDVHSALLLAKVLPQQAEPWRFVDIATPLVASDGRFMGVLAGHLSWSWASQIKRELVDTTLAEHQAEAVIVGADGTVLLGSPALQGKILPPPTSDELSVESRTRGSGSYPGLGWNVVLRQPERVAMAPYRALLHRTRLAAGFLCLLLAPLLWLLARRLALPLRELVSELLAARRVPSFVLKQPIYREAELLGIALDRYGRQVLADSDRLRELNVSLEARVQERTEKLAKSEARLRTITDNLPVLIAYVDGEQRYRFANETYRDWVGVEPRAMLGNTIRELVGEVEYGKRADALRRTFAGERVDFDLETQLQGERRCLRSTYMPDVAADGRVQGVYILVSDITATKQVEQRLEQLARSDAVTGLNNRHAFDEKLQEALARGRRSRRPVALLFLDVDRFKTINDSLGHAAGDTLLRGFAQRVMRSVRETDTVARLSGDEFAVVIENSNGAEAVQVVARKILAAMSEPFDLDGQEVLITTSIGVAVELDAAETAVELLARADSALYAAKAAGRNRFQLAAS